MNKRANKRPHRKASSNGAIPKKAVPTPAQLLPLKLLLLMLFHDLMSHFRRTYCWPTRATMQRMIRKRNGRVYSLSWIDKCIHWLNESGYVLSYFRPGRKDNGTLFNRPSNRQVTFKGLQFLRKNGWYVAHYLWEWAKDALGIKKKTAPDDRWRRMLVPNAPPRRHNNPFLE